jgi:predicted TIM-barrel fold metal-dependent hydrolase
MRCDEITNGEVGQEPCAGGQCGCTSRRFFLRSAAAAAASAVIPSTRVFAQPAGPAPRRIDVHHHFFPPFLIEAYEKAGMLNRLVPDARTWTPASSLGQMEKGGVQVAVLSTSSLLSALKLDIETNRSMSRKFNDYAADMRRDNPGRFGVFGYLPLPDIDGALKEIEYTLDVLKADGVGLMTNYGATWPGDKAYAPIFEELNRRKATLFFHPLAANCCVNLQPGIPGNFIEYPHDTTRAVFSLLFAGAFVRYRDIKWIFSHDGGTVPMMAGRVAALARDRKLDDVAPEGIEAELRRLYYETANAAYAPNMAALLKMAPLSQVMFGTDFPYVSVEQNVKDLLNSGLTPAELKAIDNENALRLFPQIKI